MPKEIKQENDILAQIKEIERMKKQALLVASIKELKRIAKEVVAAKKEMDYLLDELGLTKEDKKRVIDFINSQEDVQLTKAEKSKIKEEVKRELSGEKKKIEEKEIDWTKKISSYQDLSGQHNLLYKGSLGNSTYTNYCQTGATGASNLNAICKVTDDGTTLLVDGQELTVNL